MGERGDDVIPENSLVFGRNKKNTDMPREKGGSFSESLFALIGLAVLIFYFAGLFAGASDGESIYENVSAVSVFSEEDAPDSVPAVNEKDGFWDTLEDFIERIFYE